MRRVWIHVGMPKCGSTSIQHFLSTSLPDAERRRWTNPVVLESLLGVDRLAALLDGDWTGLDAPAAYTPCALRWSDVGLVSSEHYADHHPRNIAGPHLTGLAIVREPASWVPSSIVQTVLFGIPPGGRAPDREHYSLPSADAEGQLIGMYAWLLQTYATAIRNLRAWADASLWFDVVPYRPATDLAAVVRASLGRLGVTTRHHVSAPRLRTSYPFPIAQLSLVLYLVAVDEFGHTEAEALRLSQLALGADQGLLHEHLVPAGDAVVQQIRGELEKAHATYETLLRDFSPDTAPTAFTPNIPGILQPTFAVGLARTMLRANARLALVPDGFNPVEYLMTNPDLARVGISRENPIRFAVDHFARHGAFENRPVPMTDSPT